MLKNQPCLLIVMGPTAAGKTDYAVKLAEKFGTEVISADSRQIYREMKIGTARPDPSELRDIPHHFLGSGSIHDPYSAGRFAREALEVIERIHRNNQFVVVAGGTFLYIRALCEGLNEFPDVNPEIVQGLEAQLRTEGIESLQEQLKKLDPDYAQKADLQNPQRIIRALSVMVAGGRPFSYYLQPLHYNPPFQVRYLGLMPERTALYRKINQRVDHMMDAGLLQEAEALYPFRHLRPLQTVGYSELFEYLDGRFTLDEAALKIKQHSRNYAKRQLTWLRNMKDLIVIEEDMDLSAFL